MGFTDHDHRYRDGRFRNPRTVGRRTLWNFVAWPAWLSDRFFHRRIPPHSPRHPARKGPTGRFRILHRRQRIRKKALTIRTHVNAPRPSQSEQLPSRRVVVLDALALLGVAGLVGTVVAVQQFMTGELIDFARPALLAAVLITGHAVVLAYLATMLGPRKSPAGALLGIGFRTGVPMAALVMVSEAAPNWSEHGFGGYLVACYLPCLAAETILAVWRLSQSQRTAPAKPAITGPPS